MDTIITAIKTDLPNCLNAGRIMLVSFFVLAVFMQYVGILSRPVNWADVILKLVIGLVLIQNYTYIMDTTRTIVSDVDVMVNPNQDYVSQYAQISNNAHQQHEASIQQGVLSQVQNALFGWLSIHTLIINLSFIFYGILSKVMEAVRFSMTAILYKLGPVLIPLVLFQSTVHMVRGWYVSYVAVLCWPILWHIVLAIAVSLSANNPSLEQFACINFAVCFVLVFSPVIVNHIIAGIGTGSSSALAGYISSKTTTDVITKTGSAALGFTAARLVQPVIDKYFPSPTTSEGNFKDTMLGDKDKGDKK